MKSTRTLCLSAGIITLSLALLTSCGSEDGDGGDGKPAASPAAASQPAGLMDGGLEKLAEAAEEGSATAKAALKKIETDLAEKIEYHAEVIADLKDSAKSVTDEKLEALMDSIDVQYDKARDEIGELATGEAGAAKEIEARFDKILGELGDLCDQAKARLAELKGS